MTPSALDVSFLREALKGRRFGTPVIHRDTLESTNDLALELLDRGFPEGTLILAEEQTRGRGRRGRVWSSPPRLGIYASLLLRPSLEGALLPLVTLSASLGIARALGEMLGTGVDVKWPNDLQVNGRKLAGILAEGRSPGDGPALVVGLGLNVNQTAEDFSRELRSQVTSLRLVSGRILDRSRVLPELLLRWEEEHALLLEDGGASLLSRWESRSSLRPGARIRADLDGEPVQGLYRGLTRSGEIRLETEPGRIRRIAFGEVHQLQEGE
jgi:BirA family transcriptional regulator, biotin operon repressor / biotin---[acetyl-CoA-carboxylase] ligase